MAVPSYTTDLATLNLSTGTWGEFTGAASGSAPTENDSDNFIAGTDSTTEAVRNSGLSSMYAPANTTTIGSGDAVFMWLYFAAMPNMTTFASDGYTVAMGSAVGDYYKWTVAGKDTLPYGGWFSVAVDPATTDRTTVGTPSGTWTYFGSVINLTTGIAKGNAFANDYQRHGRSLITTVGDATTPGTFAGAATMNDDVTRRWGLFAEIPGGYTQKGLFQMGSAATAVYFKDQNKNIVIEDTIHCAAGFNEFEILNTGSTVLWTGIQISALGTQSPGIFNVTDNATVTLIDCTFNDMGAFTFNDGTNPNTVDGTTFRRCGLVTTGGTPFDNCNFASSPAAISVSTSSPTNAALITNSTFTSDGNGNGLEIGGTVSDITLTGLDFVGYSTTVDADKAIYVNIATGTITINISGGTGVTAASHVRTAGATVIVSADVTITFTGMKDNTEVRVYKTSDNSVIGGIENATAGTTDARTFAWSSPAATGVYYVLHNWNAAAPFYQTIRVEGYSVPATDTSIAIQQQIDRNAT